MAFSTAALPTYMPDRRAWILLMLALLVGLLSFSAVQEVSIQCTKKDDVYLGVEKGGCLATEKGECVLLEEGRRQCDLVAGSTRIELPVWALALFR